jgi:hypothetical protein
MSITAQSAQQLLRLLKNKVQAGTLDPETAENLAVLAIQEVKVADEESQAKDTTELPPEDAPQEEPQPPAAPAPSSAIDPSAQLLALINKFDMSTAQLWNGIKAEVEGILKGVEGAAFPLGDFASKSNTAAKGNSTKLTIKKGDKTNTVAVNFAFDRMWDIEGLNPPAVEAAVKVEPTCHLGLRKELLALAQDVVDMTDSELVWKRSKVPEKTLAFLTAGSAKENDARVAEAVKNCPANTERAEWRKWSLAAQVYVLGTDYSEKKSFKDVEKEIKE